MKAFKTQRGSTATLWAGYALFIMLLFDLGPFPIFVPSLYPYFFWKDISDDCTKEIFGGDGASPGHEIKFKHCVEVLPSCYEDWECRQNLALEMVPPFMNIPFGLSLLSVLLSPYPKRTLRGYHARLILMIFPLVFGAFGCSAAFFTILWAPLLMLTRRHWFPIPRDKTADAKNG